MRGRIIAQAVGLWLLIAVLAIANGTLREAALEPSMPSAAAQIISISILALLIGGIEWYMVHYAWADVRRRNLAWIGAAWMTGTILFEFALGRLVLDMPWHSLLQQYDLLEGNLWPLIPILMLVGMPLMKPREAR